MKARTREKIDGVLMAGPWLVGFLAFVCWPILRSLVYSFQEYDVVSPARWVGLANYRYLIRDGVFHAAMYNTAYFAVVSVPLQIVLALLLAFLMTRRIVLTSLLTTIYYLPSVITGVAVALIWKLMFQGSYGVINSLLGYVGIQGPAWLSSVAWSKPAIVIMVLTRCGYYMVIYIAAIQGIPEEFYDAADLDGAGLLVKFRRITMPLISPAIFFTIILATINSFNIFSEVYALTSEFHQGPGGPAQSTLMLVVQIYLEAFGFLRLGYASALAWVLLAIVLILTRLNFWIGKTWVHYE